MAMNRSRQYRRPTLVTLLLVVLSMRAASVSAQNTVTLNQLVLEVKHTEYISTPNTGTPNIIQVKSSNPGVATASKYRTAQVQIVAVAPGSTEVEFLDSGILYRLRVWVQAANSTGGGGAGYDRTKTQLPQIVMLVKHTQNVAVPGAGAPQISSVVSSNPSVATARTNTVNTIQIYSVALGDTFIDFTDNATRTTYQVHVWVQSTLSGPDGTGGSSGAGAKPQLKPNPVVKVRPIAGKLDHCLVGEWVSESQTSSGSPISGGAGARIIIKADGSVSVDYSAMKNTEFYNSYYKRWDSSQTWTGTALGHLSADNGSLVVDRVDRSNITTDILDANGRSMISHEWSWNHTLGAILPPSTAIVDISYTCNDSGWNVVQTNSKSATTFVMKRQRP
jgi:hypothetical protein